MTARFPRATAKHRAKDDASLCVPEPWEPRQPVSYAITAQVGKVMFREATE